MIVPWLPLGHSAHLPGRGEIFYRHHRHADESVPTLLLLHGWTASADLQFFTAYEALAEHYSYIAVDHRGHGRGIRHHDKFELVDAADDAAALVQQLGVGPVITVGYSMGGPISMLLTQRNPDLVRGLVLQATALEWRSTRRERAKWKTVHIIGPLLRSAAYPRSVRWGIRRLLGRNHPLMDYVPWMANEVRRNDAISVVHAGQSLSRYDARPWASSLDKPTACLITTRDRLVKPRKQWALADALNAFVIELPDDHLVAWTSPDAFAKASVELVRHVVR